MFKKVLLNSIGFVVIVTTITIGLIIISKTHTAFGSPYPPPGSPGEIPNTPISPLPESSKPAPLKAALAVCVNDLRQLVSEFSEYGLCVG